MDHHQDIGLRPYGRHAIGDRVLMTWMMPTNSVARVNFLVLECNPASPIESVSKLRRARNPHSLDLFAPSRLQHLIQIQRHTHVNVVRQQRERGISRIVKPPWRNANIDDFRAALAQDILRSVSRAGISDEY